MAQSSLMTWLKKPAVITEPPTQSEIPLSPANIPTPLPSAGEKNETRRPSKGTLQGSCETTSSARTLPPNVEIRPCSKEDIKSLKHLTSLLLPIPYPDKFYREIIEDEVTHNLTLVAVWHDSVPSKGREKGRLIGAIRCRLLAHSPSSTPKASGPLLYLSTLVLLSPFRGHGIAAYMLNVLIRRAVDDYGISSVGAHVWEANEEGLAWYRRRGFVEVTKDEEYYRRLKPTGALVMEKKVGVLDLVGG